VKVALLFRWDNLVGVFRSPELARREAGRLYGRELKWEKVAGMVPGTLTETLSQVVRGKSGSILFEVDEEEVREA
jgi:hypothetical protein